MQQEQEVILRVQNLRKWFQTGGGFPFSKRKYVRAVDGISFDVKRGEIFGIAGESGSGKTTAGRVLLRLIEPTSGKVYFKNKDIFSLGKKELKSMRSHMQFIFQNPYESLPPNMRVYDIIAEPLKFAKTTANKAEMGGIVKNAFDSAGLSPMENFMSKYPRQLSGGERQRVAVARAIVLQPDFIVADEPVSMLDVSIRGEILHFLLDIQKRQNLSCVLITHDLSVARYVCNRIAIMYLGKFVEMGTEEKMVAEPMHPYTRILISSVPVMGQKGEKKDALVEGEPQSLLNLPVGCRFHPRCSRVMEVCRREEPEFVEVEKGHYVACHLYSAH